jgi:excisionase family DNA binding protein
MDDKGWRVEVDISPRLLSPAQAAKSLNVTRSFLYAHLLATNALPSIKLGKCRRIPVWALDEYIARIAAEQGIVAPLIDMPPAPHSELHAVAAPRPRRKVKRANASQVGAP